MKKFAMGAAVLCCSMFMVVGSAHACGESLYRVGKGLSFREYTAPLPGSILVVARTDAELALVERLAAAGHDIKVVSDPSLIRDELNTRKFDVVLAYYSERAEVESQLESTSTAFIPVAMSGTQEVKQAKKEFRHTLSNDDDVRTFLKTIHKTLKEHA